MFNTKKNHKKQHEQQEYKLQHQQYQRYTKAYLTITTSSVTIVRNIKHQHIIQNSLGNK